MEINNKNLRKLHYGIMILGIICMASQIYHFGIYDFGEDTTLMIIGLILVGIGYTNNNLL